MPPLSSHPPHDTDTRFEQGIRSFRDQFGIDPFFVASAPGRVNLMGEHTDYNQGFVLPMAIDRRVRLLAKPLSGDVSTIHSVELDRTVTLDLTRPGPPVPRDDPRFFANYVLGVAQEFRRLGHRLPNLQLLITSDVPLGAGLASSAALEVAMATMLESLLGISLKPLEKILLCQRAEHAFPGTPCGIMDMYIATLARADHALLIDCRTNESQAIPVPDPKRVSWLIADTGVRHELASSEYARRRATCAEVVAMLEIDSLRDATLAMLANDRLTEIQRRRATHVISENTRTLLATEALRQDDLSTFGTLMFQSHDSLRDLFEVSCPELDTLVETARTLHREGVYGARMTGGGFGGSAIVLCKRDADDGVRGALLRAFRDAHGVDATIIEARASVGAMIEMTP